MSEPAPIDDASSSRSSEDILDLKDDEGWEDAELDVEETQFKSLLDDEVFSNILEMLKHCKERHKFDFLAVRQVLALDFYDNIKLVNYIRSLVQNGEKLPETISKSDFEDEKFLKPVLEDDALLFSLDDLPEVEETAPANRGDLSGQSGELVARVSELEEELRRMQAQFDNYRATVAQTLDDRWSSGPTKAEEEEKRDDDSHYFSSYSYNGPSFIDFLSTC
jgi:protein arginine N-methyltransferase 3